MRNTKTKFLGAALSLGAVCGVAGAQQIGPLTSSVTSDMVSVKGPHVNGLGPVRIITPDSSVEQPGDVGNKYHTHYNIVVPPEATVRPGSEAASPQAAGNPPFTGYFYETPASLACIYAVAPVTMGCDPNKLTAHTSGGSKAIALVDAFDNPSAVTDLKTYSTQFGLPAPNFQVVFATGTRPPGNTGWALEEALDIEMAHAMAPTAKIYLVEAASNSTSDLNVAVDKAYQLVSTTGGMISMSYGSTEYSGETANESHFAKSTFPVTFFASTGDDISASYPATSPNVVAVGGTATSRDLIHAPGGAFTEETAWPLAGVGLSTVFARPSYQNGVRNQFGNINARAIPDISAVASAQTPVWVYCGAGCGSGGWFAVNGTSVASPLVAGLANRSGKFRKGSAQLLGLLYGQVGTSAFFDVTRGVCGPYAAYFTSAATASNKAGAYDLCTGLGSPRGAVPF